MQGMQRENLYGITVHIMPCLINLWEGLELTTVECPKAPLLLRVSQVARQTIQQHLNLML